MSTSTYGYPPQYQGPQALRKSLLDFDRDINTARRERVAKHPIDARTDSPDAWSSLSHTLQQYDEATIGSYKEDIDTLLVFAGLFLAVLAAFIAESFKLLQANNDQLSVQLLSQIVQQLNSFNVNPSFANSSYQAVVPPLTPNPPVSVLFVNILWFISLILCLVTASLGMLVKQWLREYLSNDSTSPQARVRIRYMRNDDLERWRVFAIAGTLPSFLQTSLVLFLAGICLFTWQFHYTLFYTTTSVVAIWILWYIYILIAPLFSSRCPYKSASLKSATRSIRQSIHQVLRHVILSHLPWRRVLGFLDPGEIIDDDTIRCSAKQDEAIWTQADTIFSDDRLVKNTIHTCLADASGPATVRSVRGIIARRTAMPEPANLTDSAQDSVSLALSNVVINNLRAQSMGTGDIHWEPWMQEAYCLLLENWSYCSEESGKYHLVDLLLAIIKQSWSISEHILRWSPDVSLEVLCFALSSEGIGGRKRLRNSEKLVILRQIMRSLRTLVGSGPLAPHDSPTSPPNPDGPTKLNLVMVTQALLQIYKHAPLIDLSDSYTLQFTREVSDHLEEVITLAFRMVECGHLSPSLVDRNDALEWSDVILTFQTVVQTLRISGHISHINLAWSKQLEDLYLKTEQKRWQGSTV